MRRQPHYAQKADDSVELVSKKEIQSDHFIVKKSGQYSPIQDLPDQICDEFSEPHPKPLKKREVVMRPLYKKNRCADAYKFCARFVEDCRSSSDQTTPPDRLIYFGVTGETTQDMDGRLVQCLAHNEMERGSNFPDNYVSTTKYPSILAFIPLNLFEQFQRAANFYFLIVSVLTFWLGAEKSPVLPVWQITPLVCVLTISAVKDAWEDYQRWKMDKQVNNTEVDVWTGETFEKKRWQELRVGDAIRVVDGAFIPSDILVLQTSEGKGICNIETSNLDGETNLKIKQALLATAELNTGVDDLDGDHFLKYLDLEVRSEAPNEKMTSKGWKGNMVVNHDKDQKQAVGMTNMILRGCSLQNTGWVIGLVVFSGVETKLMLNNKIGTFKRSHLDWGVDYMLYRVFAVQFCCCLLGFLGMYFWRTEHQNEHWYMYLQKNKEGTEIENIPRTGENSILEQSLENFAIFCILFGNLVPISLYVQIEFSKFFQSYFIGWDNTMCYLDEEDMEKMKEPNVDKTKVGIWSLARTSGLVDELGQVGWVFSDKTGTLTRNVMEFMNCYICTETCSVAVKCDVRMSPGEFEKLDKEAACRDFVHRIELDSFTANSVGCSYADDSLAFHVAATPAGKKVVLEDAKTVVDHCEKLVDTVNALSGPFSVSGVQVKSMRANLVQNAGKKYGPGHAKKAGECVSRIPKPPKCPAYNNKECRFADERLAWESRYDRVCDQFLTALAVCHTVIPEEPKDKSDPLNFGYQAASPDEKALVTFAKNLHYFFQDVEAELITIAGKKVEGTAECVVIHGEEQVFHVYEVIEFNSARKRMSVVCRDPRDGKYKIFCKGADNIIAERLCKQSKNKDWYETEGVLQSFAVTGLRTLAIAYRELSEEELVQWLDDVAEAKNDLEHGEERLPVVMERLEKELTLLGVTAIEDRLQDGVPATIESLHQARMNIWVLTGDKVETAINIGRSCQLLTDKMIRENNTLFVIDPEDKDENRKEKSDEIVRQEVKAKFTQAKKLFANHTEEDKHNQGLVLSGRALGFVFPIRQRDARGKEIPPTVEQLVLEEEMQELTLEVCEKCSAVLCCRVSPKQKAQMVQLVKFNKDDAVTLAIGDGANDVPMIRAAHVGVGIKGHEGIQAVMASDYAIGQFRYLQELLFIHGAWNYRRLTILTLFTFYKNILIAFPQLWFAILNRFSGSLWGDQLVSGGYNLFFSSMPIMFLGLFDRPYPKKIALLVPSLYGKNDIFTMNYFYFYSIQGIVHSLATFYVPTFWLDSFPTNQDGREGTTLGFCTSMLTSVTAAIFVCTLKCAMESRLWLPVNVFGFVGSFILWFGFELMYGTQPITSNHCYPGTAVIFSSDGFWMAVIFILFLCLVPEMSWRWCLRYFKRTEEDCIQEMDFSSEEYKDFVERLERGQKAKIERKKPVSSPVSRSSFVGSGFVPLHDREAENKGYSSMDRTTARRAMLRQRSIRIQRQDTSSNTLSNTSFRQSRMNVFTPSLSTPATNEIV